MGDVVDLKRPPGAAEEQASTPVYVCSACGCQSFYLHASGKTECCNCGDEDVSTRMWRELAFPPEMDTIAKKPDDPDAMRVVQIGDERIALKRVIRTAQSMHSRDELVMLIAIGDDSTTSVWRCENLDNRGRLRWVQKRLAEVLRGVTDRKLWSLIRG